MAARRPRLNNRQTAVLLWIADGCPEGRWEGYAHRVSAAALRSRGLVRISGRGKTWAAELTEAGRDFLEAVDRDSEEGIAPDGEMDAVRSGARSGKGRSRPPLSKTEKLVHDVVAADGTLRVPNERSGVDYRQRAYAAQRFGKVPEGKHLAVTRVGDEFEISLRDGAGTTIPEGELRVPARVGRYHRVARELRQRTAIQEVSRAQLPRWLRIVHALAVEIKRRGHEIECVDGHTEWKGSSDGQLVVTIDGHSYRLRIYEKGVGNRGAWEQAKARRKEALEHPRSYGWFPERPKPYDAEASGVLEISIDSGYGRPGVATVGLDASRGGAIGSDGALKTGYHKCSRSLSFAPSRTRSGELPSNESAKSANGGGRRQCVRPRSASSRITALRSFAPGFADGKRRMRSASTATPWRLDMETRRSPRIRMRSAGWNSRASTPTESRRFRGCRPIRAPGRRISSPISAGSVPTALRTNRRFAAPGAAPIELRRP